MKPQQAIITFDPDRIAALDLQAEAGVLAHIIRQALLRRDYPRERGIVSIEVLQDGCELFVKPPHLGHVS